MTRVAIIGGGISGLSAACYLAEAGIAVTLVEKEPRLGGVTQTSQLNGCLIESGPDSFLTSKPWALELIRELGIEDQVIGSNDSARVTYIWKRGRLRPLPDGLVMMVPTRIMPLVSTSLLSWPAKGRMAFEWFRRPPIFPLPDRSVADFIRDHFGNEAVDYLAEPLLAGIYGGDPSTLGVRSVLPRFVDIETRYGSLSRGLVQERKAERKTAVAPLFSTLKGGMGSLVRALEQRIGPRVQILRGVAETIEQTAAGFRARVAGNWLDSSHVVLASPAYSAGKLVEAIDGELAGLLGSIAYRSAVAVTLGFERRSFDHPLHGFGFLVPKRERRYLVACTWVGKKFAHRVPDDTVLLRCFMGDAIAENDETLIANARGDLRTMMGIAATPAFHQVSRWPQSMAQYGVGHEDLVRRIEERIAEHPGILLAGNAYHGIGVPDCIRMGREAAMAVLTSSLRRVPGRG